MGDRKIDNSEQVEAITTDGMGLVLAYKFGRIFIC